MKKILFVIFLLSFYFGIKSIFSFHDRLLAELTLVTGLVLAASYLLSISIKYINLPKLTVYMSLGVVLGPVGLNFLNENVQSNLKFLEHIALSFIALTAGGEFKYRRFLQYRKTIISVLIGQNLIVFLGLLLLIVYMADFVPYFNGIENKIIFGFAILFAGTAISKSPATTVGIITELQSRGKITDIVLSVTVLKSILLIVMFPLIVTWAKSYLIPDVGLGLDLLYELSKQIFGSIMMGILIGGLIIWYLRYVKVERSIFLIGVSIVIVELTSMFNLEILLISIVAGITVENFSKQGVVLIREIEKSSLPLYIVFFCFAGAALHIDTLRHALGLTLILVVARMAFIFVGTYLGAAVSGEGIDIRRKSWMGYIGQAGIAIGLASIIEKSIPGGVGTQIRTILLASIVLNEFLGPIFFKHLLTSVGEARKL